MLNKAMYDLKQGSRALYQRLSIFLIENDLLEVTLTLHYLGKITLMNSY